MTAPDLDALEKLADEATPGPWFQGHGENGSPQGPMAVWPDKNMVGGVIAKCGWQMPWDGWFEQPDKDAAFIAAANPATIKALIAELKEARGLMTRGVKEAIPDAMIFASHTNPQRYKKAITDVRSWTGEVNAFLARNGKGEG